MSERKEAFRPSDFQPDLPVGEIVLDESPSEDAVPLDILFVGAGPASLAGAIKLAQLVKEENERTHGAFGEVSHGHDNSACSMQEHSSCEEEHL